MRSGFTFNRLVVKSQGLSRDATLCRQLRFESFHTLNPFPDERFLILICRVCGHSIMVYSAGLSSAFRNIDSQG